MPIDWFTVAAQVFNFLLLVVLLRIFLYRPILNAMDKREEDIASRLEDAEQRRDEAEEERRDLENQHKEFGEQKDGLFEEARKKADERKKQLIENARQEAEAAKHKWLEQVDQGRESFLKHLRHRIAAETCALARKALADMADAGLETQMVRAFLRRINDLSDEDRDAFSRMNPEDQPVVRNAFDLSEEMRGEIRESWKEATGSNHEMHFEKCDDLLCGIELRVCDRKIEWTLDNYLETLEQRLSEAIDKK